MSATEDLPRELRDEREIVRCVLRYCRGIDRRDLELVRSCYHPDARDDHGSFIGRIDDYIAFLAGRLPRWDATMHFIGNVLVDLRGDEADVESYCLAMHRRSEDAQEVTIALRYVDRFERREGEWRIADRRCVVDWSTTGPLRPESAGSELYLRGRHDPEDEVMTRTPPRPPRNP